MEWFNIGLSVVAILWLIFREVAPKTSWKWDDKLVNILDGVADATGVEPRSLMERGKKRRESGKQSAKDT